MTGASDLGSTLRVRGDALFDSKVTVVGKFVALWRHTVGKCRQHPSLEDAASVVLGALKRIAPDSPPW